jgi:hypothetical protein
MAVEIKSVRVRKSNISSGTLDIRVAIYEDNQSRNEEGKLVFNNRVLIGFDNNNNKIVWTKTNYSKLLTTKYKDFTDEQFIKEFIDMNSKMDGGGNEYKIIQDPWKDNVPIIRNYGFDPYYLNNGAEVYISWTDVDSRISEGGEKYSKSDGTEITYDPTFYRETGNVKPLNITKSIRIVHKEETQNLTLNKNNEFEYTIYSNDYRGTDLIVLDILIGEWKRKIPNYDLALCSPNNESCSIIPYKSPLKPFVPDVEPTSIIKTATNETPKEKINVVLSTIPIKTKIDTVINVYIGKPNEIKDININNTEDNFEGLSDEYTEEAFVGSEEAPIDLPDMGTAYDNIQETSSESVYNPGSVIPGKVVSLPGKYSHTGEQGFNLLNSQWIGDLIASAISHIGHPTYDIEGTEQGALGCASAVSMIFYRAFGVHMKTGKAVKSTPKSIGDFGSKGTGELAGWLSNGSLYTRVSWQNAQPGDILNTARGSKAGHIGVVINTTNGDGSWNVISNSSKGFAGGGGGAVKLNYSVKKWKSVADRNPSGTFAYRYIGPKQSTGQSV